MEYLILKHPERARIKDMVLPKVGSVVPEMIFEGYDPNNEKLGHWYCNFYMQDESDGICITADFNFTNYPREYPEIKLHADIGKNILKL